MTRQGPGANGDVAAAGAPAIVAQGAACLYKWRKEGGVHQGPGGGGGVAAAGVCC